MGEGGREEAHLQLGRAAELRLVGLANKELRAVEHARAAIMNGAIGDVLMAQSTLPDRCGPLLLLWCALS